MARAAYLTDMQICTRSQLKSRYNNNNKKETDYFQNFTRDYKLSIMLNATQVLRSAYTADGTLKSQKNLIASHRDLVTIFAWSRPARAYQLMPEISLVGLLWQRLLFALTYKLWKTTFYLTYSKTKKSRDMVI